jgi:peptidylprolyl isomerase
VSELRAVLLGATLAVGLAALGPVACSAPPATPASVLAAAPDSAWKSVDPNDLLVMDLANGKRVVILLADAFAPAHIANIRALARAHWWDGLAIERVQDDYVVQWGDPDGRKPLPPGVGHVPAEYERPAAGAAMTPLAFPDTYAPHVGLAGPFPAASDGAQAWLTHCYGVVGVGRDVNPDVGTGAELYAVIGQPPRQLDRNIAVVGRVLSGIEQLSSLPRGTADLGFYATPAERTGIRQVRIASDLPPADQPRFQVLDVTSPTFTAWIHVKANRQDSFYLRPAGALDVCNAMPPARATPSG